ncbi:peptide chain release factor N(5)-glutamine methyltransferase [Pseudodesulfovibrio sediminis]|uniref:Release factor glutamine methyltransferase n=1 Tax=Pseudodesulfovibrio sediminis TaxID=2810563 RepID=A0ABM7P3S1_9BACT|nr:peptide chain release factor N(5)-glutamine methyltransferase [Pseudodesulfovibrio sediminis]BCS87411.1 release factor glutamine methyltransferase [Pseudodesulfovibrio sediminis]
MSFTVQNYLVESEARLAGVDSPRLSAELLAAHVLGCSRLALVVDRNRVFSDTERAEIELLLKRREAGEPIAYILGEKEFYGLDFQVGPGVLIPRPETEHIIEEVEQLHSKDKDLHFADLGTGSGILAVTISHLFPQASCVAVDICQDALKIASENARMHGVEDRVECMEGDFTKRLFTGESFDFIVSNPPYVSQVEFEEASHEVTAFEPTGALVSGPEGLDHVRQMLPEVVHALRPGGHFFMEIGYKQGDAVKKIISQHFPQFEDVKVIPDLAGLDRVVFAQKV